MAFPGRPRGEPFHPADKAHKHYIRRKLAHGWTKHAEKHSGSSSRSSEV